MLHRRAQPSLLIGWITRRRAGLTRLDVLVVIGLLWLVAGAGLQSAQQQWETSNRIACGSNLRQIGQAMRQYAIDDVRGGNYPRTLYDPATADKPNFGTPYEGSDLKARDGVDPFVTRAAAERGHVPAELVAYAPAPNDVTAAFWHLLRSTELTVPVFICPSTRREPLPLPEGGAGKMQYTNWPGIAALRNHLSFSFHNMYATPQGVARGHRWTDALNSTFVLAADMNPGTDELLGLMVKTAPPFKPDGTPADDQPRPYNSPNHFGYGQNVLFADGSVKFMVSPMAGVQGDNIYAFRRDTDLTQPAGDQPVAGIIGPPGDASDSVLLPTAIAIRQESAVMTREEEARLEVDRAQLRQRHQAAMAQGETTLRQTRRSIAQGRAEVLDPAGYLRSAQAYYRALIIEAGAAADQADRLAEFAEQSGDEQMLRHARVTAAEARASVVRYSDFLATIEHLQQALDERPASQPSRQQQ